MERNLIYLSYFERFNLKKFVDLFNNLGNKHNMNKGEVLEHLRDIETKIEVTISISISLLNY